MHKAWSISQAKEGNFKNEVNAVVHIYSEEKLYVGISYCVGTQGFMMWLVRTMSTHWREIGSHCSEQAQVRICTLAG